MAVASQFQKYIDNDYNNLEVDSSDIEVAYPPSDSSHSTRMELEELENIVREAKLPNAIMIVADKEPLRLFYSVAKKKGLDPLEDEAQQWADDWTKLSFEYKLKFKRRRPYEVKKEHDIDFIVDKSDTSDSPSYPSGHALMGYGVAEFYKDKYPLMAKEWDNVADIIAHSRLQMGVHYPSDVSASKKIVADITGNSKEARLLPHNLRERLRKYIKANPVKAADNFRTITSTMYKELTDYLDTEELLSKFSSDNDLPPPSTISEQDWAKEEHSNTKLPRWFRESAMQEAIADELGFSEDNSPTFHKNENPELQGSNAYYDPGFHEIHYDTGEWTPGVLAHEIGHSTMDISPGAKLFNIGKDLTQVSALPLALAATSSKVNKRAPTLVQGLKATGGISSKLKTLLEGAKGRGGRWASGAVALAGLGTLLEEARASAKGYQGIDRLVEEGILSEEQAELSKDTMQGAFGTYLKGFPIQLTAGLAGKELLGAGARLLLPSKVRLGLAGTLGALGAAGVAAGHFGGSRDIINSPVFGRVNLFDNPLHHSHETKTASTRGGFLTSGDTTPPTEADLNYAHLVPAKPKRKRKDLEEIVLRVKEEIAKASPEDMEYSKQVASGLPMEEIIARELIDPFTSRDNWKLTPEEYKQFRYSVIKDKKKLYPVARPFALAERYGIDLGLPADVAQEEARSKRVFRDFSYPSFHTARGAFLAETARDLVPEDKQHLVDELISRIGRARIHQGVHSHQDVEAGELLGREAAKIYKEKGIKTSSIDLLTGRMGAGKSTLLNKLRDQYDIVEGTDLGSVVDGKFVEPSDEDKPRLRQEKADRLLSAHNEGKRVLMEGYPPGLFRIPGMVEAADRAVILEPDLLQRLMQIGNRSKERGTSIEEDIRFAVSPEHSAKEQKYLDMLREAIEGTHVAPTSEEAESYLLGKQANDLTVLTAVPKQNLDLIMRKGLASQKAISEDPELTKAFLDQRGIKEEDWRKELSDALKGFKSHNRLGPSVFFSEPDPDKVSDPRHFINQFDTATLRVNLGKLLKDIPETRFHGVQLEPFNEEAWEADPDNYPSRRHRDLTTDEIAAFIAKDPKELWKDYKEEYIGKYYAGDVPHGMVITPSGIIPPEYLEQVEKTSEAKPDLNNFIKYIEEEARKRGVKDMHVVMSHPDHPLGGGSAHYTTDLDKDSKSALLIKALRGKMREWEQQQGLDPDHDWNKTSSAKDILRELIIEASKDPEVGDFVFPEDSSRFRVPITDESGDPVGFFTPRKVKDKEGKEYIRAGATYVTPSKRGSGAAGRALKEFYEDKPGLALIKDDNKPSINSYLRAGFSKAHPSSREKGYTWYEKQSSAEEQPLLRHRSTLLIRDPETGKLLAAKEPPNSKASPFYFPGGGLYADEYDTPRNPSDEDIIEGARREALEELGIELDNPRVVGSYGQELEDWWKEKTLKNRGVPYLGGHEHYVLADRGKEDRSLYNIEGDAFEQGDYYDPKEIVEALSRVAKGDSTFAPFNREQVRAIKDNLLKKKASDLSDLEAQFQPDLTPDDLKALGVYDQVYGDAPSEASMKEWPEHWINKQDPLGWLQWYDRYSSGRRTDDDERQIKRWKSFKARHLAQYLKKPTPRRAAALRNWGIDVKDLS